MRERTLLLSPGQEIPRQRDGESNGCVADLRESTGPELSEREMGVG